MPGWRCKVPSTVSAFAWINVATRSSLIQLVKEQREVHSHYLQQLSIETDCHLVPAGYASLSLSISPIVNSAFSLLTSAVTSASVTVCSTPPLTFMLLLTVSSPGALHCLHYVWYTYCPFVNYKTTNLYVTFLLRYVRHACFCWSAHNKISVFSYITTSGSDNSTYM